MKLDLLITGADVITMHPARPRASSIGIWQGRVVGLDEELDGLGATTRVDLRGRTVVPGFHDVHNHMAGFGRTLLELDAGACHSLDELYRRIAERAAQLPDGAWIVASGYDQTRLGGHPSRGGLDVAAPGHPVLVHHRTTHSLVASTPVFDRLGAMSPVFPDPDGGFVERAVDGTPTGLVVERAMAPVRDLLRPVPVDDLVDALARASEVYLSEGITSVSEAGIGASAVLGSSPIELAAWQQALDTGALRVRAQVMVAAENLHAVEAHVDDRFGVGLDLGLRTGLGDEWLSVGPLKMMVDGALGSRTAELTSDFSDHGGTGVLQFPAEQIVERARQAHVGGWQLAIHAIGDRAVDVALDAIETALGARPLADHRHRIEHACVVRPDQIERMAGLGVIPSPQARFVHELGDAVPAALGAERMPWAYRHGSFVRAGLVVPGGSDRPVVQGAPLLGMQTMVDRLTSSGASFGADEAVDQEEALRAYTVHAAHASRQEQVKGRLRAGMFADLVVLGADPTVVARSDVGAIPVLATVVGGQARFDPDRLFA